MPVLSLWPWLLFLLHIHELCPKEIIASWKGWDFLELKFVYVFIFTEFSLPNIDQYLQGPYLVIKAQTVLTLRRVHGAQNQKCLGIPALDLLKDSYIAKN